MQLETTVTELINMLNDILNEGFLRGDRMEQDVMELLGLANRDLDYAQKLREEK